MSIMLSLLLYCCVHASDICLFCKFAGCNLTDLWCVRSKNATVLHNVAFSMGEGGFERGVRSLRHFFVLLQSLVNTISSPLTPLDPPFPSWPLPFVVRQPALIPLCIAVLRLKRPYEYNRVLCIFVGWAFWQFLPVFSFSI